MKRVDLNMDFSKPIALDTEAIDWVASPQAGVERRRLEREFEESGHTTSVVRYAADSVFPPHTHGGGEEFLVLDGTFSDENGDYPAGTYVRNPPGSSHAPFSKDGCTIFVKLCQMAPQGEPQRSINTRTADWTNGTGIGHQRLKLFENQREQVMMERLSANAKLAAETLPGGAELFVVEGDLTVNDVDHGAGAWVRIPPGGSLALASPIVALFWIKRGHLTSR